MKISQFFEARLGAKLRNSRWSWGAIDGHGRVFLRVWEDTIRTVDGRDQILVGHKRVRSEAQRNYGFEERLEHIALIRNGAEGFGVLCTAFDTTTHGPRKIKRFDENQLLRFGTVHEEGDLTYALIEARFPVREIARTRAADNPLAEDLRSILYVPEAIPTTADALVAARFGQGLFRLNVLRSWGNRCAVSGSSTLDAIRASHIKPWRDSTDTERLDPANGLPLLANYDALFDAGLISFESSGDMIVSTTMHETEQELIQVVGRCLRQRPSDQTAEYLAFHRANIFQQ